MSLLSQNTNTVSIQTNIKQPVIIVEDINLYNDPAGNISKFTEICGEQTVITERINDWAYIKDTQNAGWVEAKYLLDTPQNTIYPTHSLYSMANLNIRSSPCITDNIIGSINYKEPIDCTDTMIDGWQQVIYDGNTAYAYGSYLSDQEPEDIDIYESYNNTNDIPDVYTYGSAGRLIIPDLNINVAAYYTDLHSSQGFVNAYDSAAYILDEVDIIADHCNQGFSGLYSAYPGCSGYFEYSDGSISYITCQSVSTNGWTDEYDLYDNYGTTAYTAGYPLVIYTCNPGGWPSVTITYWTWS